MTAPVVGEIVKVPSEFTTLLTAPAPAAHAAPVLESTPELLAWTQNVPAETKALSVMVLTVTPLLKVCRAVQVLAWPSANEPTTAPVVGEMVSVPSPLLTLETAPPAPQALPVPLTMPDVLTVRHCVEPVMPVVIVPVAVSAP